MSYEEMLAMQFEEEEQKAQAVALAALETRANWGKEDEENDTFTGTI